MNPADEMRRQLDALLGSNRNDCLGAKSQHFTDPEICHNFCCGLCPHDLFNNTVCQHIFVNLLSYSLEKGYGTVPKAAQHGMLMILAFADTYLQPMKLLYESERKKKDYGFERDLARTLYDLIADCDIEVERYILIVGFFPFYSPRQAAKLKDTDDEKPADDPISRQLAELQVQADKVCTR
jgi:hypothetical protein